MALIAIESFALSSRVTGGWLWYVVTHLHIQMSGQQFAHWHHLLRKTGHFVGYGILCVLCFRACWHTFGQSRLRTLRIRCASLAVAMTWITAMLDEWHQSFDPTRTSSLRDVCLDVTGGIVFLLIALFVLKLWRKAPMAELQPLSI